MSVRVRFAPSPTGHLHIGGARTALFNWLYARHVGGELVLRIEDTDVARNSPEAIDAILDGLRWLGVVWDEGPETGDVTGPARGDRGPYFQSQRKENYQRRVEALLSRDLAYEQDGAIRFRMHREATVFHDLIVGEVRRELTDREREQPDFVIVRSDGEPVFHLTNVVDDLEMDITHVIRGEDHLSNTPKHIALFEAFGVPAPHYAHIPLILNPDGSKMSKRDEGASLQTYLEEGYAPEAVANYLCLLGWSPKDDTEIFSLEELVERFDLAGVVRHNARFDHAKLEWMNGQHLARMSAERFYELAIHALERAGLDPHQYPPEYVKAALDTCRGKLKTFGELPAYAGFYFQEEVVFDPEAAAKHLTPENRPLLEKLRAEYASLEDFTAGHLEARLKNTAGELGVKVRALVHPLRVACTGRTVGPSLYHLIEVLGREKTLARMDRALARMREK